MIRVYATNMGQRSGSAIAEFAGTEFIMLAYAVGDLGAKLPTPRAGSDVRVDAAACTNVLNVAHAQAHEVDRVLEWRIPGEGVIANRARWDTLLDAMRTGARHDGLLVESD